MLLPPTCPVCRRPGPAPCEACRDELEPAPALPPPPGVDRCRAVLAYDGAARELVARLKYRNARSALAWLAGSMAALVDPASIDVVTWVPTTTTRRRQRGFDQSALLATRVAARLGRPSRPLLRRGPGPPQTGRTLSERRRGPDLVADQPAPRRVLLVDDVVTSGASVAAAARALRAAGAETVVVVAAARTPRRARRA